MEYSAAYVEQFPFYRRSRVEAANLHKRENTDVRFNVH